MTNALAISAVSACLKKLLLDRLAEENLEALGNVEVTLGPPDQQVGEDEKNCLCLYLWKVTHNPAFANECLPSHTKGGARRSNPRLGLDLHFILSATGDNDLNPSILLGAAMQQLHETSMLTKDFIEEALYIGAPAAVINQLNASEKLLATSDLSQAFERVKITPEKTEDEDLFKLWPAFNVALRMSALYRVSVVLIEADRETPEGPPVRDFNLMVHTLKRPTINRILAQPGAIGAEMQPTVQPRAGERIAIIGTGLLGEHLGVFVGGMPIALDGTADLSDQRFSVVLPATLGAGLHLASVEHRWDAGNGDLRLREVSQGAAVIVAPTPTNIVSVGIVAVGAFSGTVTVSLANPAQSGQSLRLYLSPDDPHDPRRAFTANELTTASRELTFAISDLKTGSYTWQLSVDGGESQPAPITFAGP